MRLNSQSVVKILPAMLICVSAMASDGCTGGNWKQGSTLPILEQPTWGDDDAHAWPRIPSAVETGIVNTRFQWMPSAGDFVVYFYEKSRPWLQTKALPFLRKWVPILAHWEQNYEKARNAIIIATPIILKAMKRI